MPSFKEIPLAQLNPSPLNVRSDPSDDEIEALAESIAAKGILQPLLVRPAGKEHYEVVAGERRRQALRLLADQGRIDADAYKVPCNVRKGSDADGREDSLTENVMRRAMSPVDEFEAFAGLIEGGKAAEQIARAFGISVRQVNQRLRLGRLAPVIRDAVRSGELSLDLACAFAVTDDTDEQLRVFNDLRGRGGSLRYQSPYAVRRALTEAKISADSHLARFVGAEAYVAAGGGIIEDLFSDARYLTNRALLERLALAKLETIAESEQAQGWKWAHVSLGFDSAFMPTVLNLPSQAIEPTPEQCQEIETLEARYDALAEMDDSDGEITAELERIEQRLEVLQDLQTVYIPEDKARGGIAVFVDADGRPRVLRGLITRQDAAARDADAGGDAATDGNGPAGDDPDREAEAGEDRPAVEPVAADPVDSGPALSMALKQDLAVYRTQILRVYLADNPEAAFDLLVFRIAHRLLGIGYRSGTLGIDVHEAELQATGDDLNATAAGEALARRRGALDTSWLFGPPEEQFAAFRGLSRPEKDRILAYCVALSVGACWLNTGSPGTDVEVLAGDLGVDIRRYWRPTGANTWSRTTKAQILGVLAELGGPAFVRRYDTLRKDSLVTAIDQVFSGSADVDGDIRERAARWLPAGMAFLVPAASEGGPSLDDGTAEIDAETPTGETEVTAVAA